MGNSLPKQYLPLGDKNVIEQTLLRLTSHTKISAVVVAINRDDNLWQSIDIEQFEQPVSTVEGGSERCHSVFNALESLVDEANPDDWVLVHDAARPCLCVTDIDKLITRLEGHEVGGVLGIPITDTVKRTNAQGEVLETVSREGLWRAATPQMFRFGRLHGALSSALNAEQFVTDEAAAIEWLGMTPLMVEGRSDNIKITHPEDLALAQFFLQQQERES